MSCHVSTLITYDRIQTPRCTSLSLTASERKHRQFKMASWRETPVSANTVFNLHKFQQCSLHFMEPSKVSVKINMNILCMFSGKSIVCYF